MAPTYLDLFSGAGLSSLGAEMAGFEVVAGFEKDEKLSEFYKQNFCSALHCKDINEVNFSGYRGVDHVHGSPPCQAFSQASSAAAKQAREGEVFLALQWLRAVEEIRPISLSLEQVPGFARSPAYAEIAKRLPLLGYWVNAEVVDASDFGVPQRRQRLFIRGTRNPELLSEATLQYSLFDRGSVRWDSTTSAKKGWYEAIADLLPDLPEVSFADWQKRQLPDELPSLCLVPRVGARNMRLYSPEETAPTLRALGHCRHWRQWDVWDGRVLRKGTTRCFARIQSVPDTFNLPTVDWLAAKGLGNGVPPELQRAMLQPFVKRK